ncbi:tripartite tricarboxylate transporter substrate binding protein [Roseococcus sp. SDR]|uniref:Bug family tripartite tricarboxylate transporter substrate binding protein n=1 Tax=Roseococcus sp. SDR TaxID=2835532 RepID=UPI001BCA9EBB|nr:tripartite tricarboxylate transporter substrate-binding protein [Roseococcus sp. SDR]MBS7792653.1 tripartite tricarboxylate transporter substrate binding protein [Roseococcus sp. SDR]MBV1847967.1 tripartite tricarboxylate transporter substrate binding protein [Roseococcus sp. SDR]
MRAAIRNRLRVAAALLALPAIARAQDFPRQQIRLILPFAPGTGSDAIARIVAHETRNRLPHPIVVENRPGGGGITGTEQGARAAPDGYTLTLGTTSTFLVNPALNPRAGYSFERDFAPVVGIGRSFYVVVTANTAAAPKTLGELIERLRQPGAHGTFASSGAGTITHLASEIVLHKARVTGTHVPYRGSGAAMADIIGGQVLFGSDSLAATLPLIRGGQLRALAVTSPTRFAGLPDLPTLIESGMPGTVIDAWFGIGAPIVTPAPLVSQLSEVILAAITSEEAKPRFEALGVDLLALGPAGFAQFVRESGVFWRDFLRESGIRIEF